jgi:hypothetical protein
VLRFSVVWMGLSSQMRPFTLPIKHYIMRRCRRMDVYIRKFLTSASVSGAWSALRPSCYNPRKESAILIAYEARCAKESRRYRDSKPHPSAVATTSPLSRLLRTLVDFENSHNHFNPNPFQSRIISCDSA